jgi:hypothetical protein
MPPLEIPSQRPRPKRPLRTTADRGLIEEDTGDWLVLDTPPCNSKDGKISLQSDQKPATAKSPAIGLPEAKNGATGLDNPRTRKPIMRLLRNKFYGLDRPSVKGEENSQVVSKKKLCNEIKELREKGVRKADMMTLNMIREYCTMQRSKSLGGDWFERAMTDNKFWLLVLEKVSELCAE